MAKTLELVLPGAFPDGWISRIDGYGQPVDANQWYWAEDIANSADPETGEAIVYYAIRSGPVSPLTFEKPTSPPVFEAVSLCDWCCGDHDLSECPFLFQEEDD